VTTATPSPSRQRPQLLRGKARMAELATSYEVERRTEEQSLLRDLGREPSHAERLLIENSAGLAVRARRLRRLGRDGEADDVVRLLLRALIKLGSKPGKARPASIEEWWQASRARSAQGARPQRMRSQACSTTKAASCTRGWLSYRCSTSSKGLALSMVVPEQGPCIELAWTRCSPESATPLPRPARKAFTKEAAN
jgi:hypothetical protein